MRIILLFKTDRKIGEFSEEVILTKRGPSIFAKYFFEELFFYAILHV